LVHSRTAEIDVGYEDGVCAYEAVYLGVEPSRQAGERDDIWSEVTGASFVVLVWSAEL